MNHQANIILALFNFVCLADNRPILELRLMKENNYKYWKKTFEQKKWINFGTIFHLSINLDML